MTDLKDGEAMGEPEIDPLMSVSELFSRFKERGGINYLVDPWIPLGSMISLSGEPKCGKSVFVTNLAVSVARGGSWLGMKVRQGPVLWYAFEESLEERVDVLQEYGDLEGLPISTVLAVSPLNSLHGLTLLRERIRSLSPVLVVIDPLVAAFGIVDFNDQSATRAALQRLKDLCNEFKTTMILIHHLRKDASGGPMNRHRHAGSAQIIATCSADWIVNLKYKNPWRMLVQITGRMVGQKTREIVAKSKASFTLLPEKENGVKRLSSEAIRLMDLLMANPNLFRRRELIHDHGFTESALRRAIDNLAKLEGFERTRGAIRYSGPATGRSNLGEYDPYRGEG